MVRRMLWRVLALALFAVPGLPAHAAEAYQVSTISSLLAGGYDGTITVGEILRHGNFGLGTFNGVDGEMMVLDGQVYRATVDGRAHLVDPSELTPFAVVVPFQPQSSMAVAAGQSLEQLEAALDALPYSASRILAARVDGRFQAIRIRSEPKQNPPYRSLVEVIKTQQVVHTLNDVQGTLIGFRFPAAASSVNVAGWHFHFLSADKTRGGHVLAMTTGDGVALVEEISDLRISFPASAPASTASAESIKAVERPGGEARRVSRARARDGHGNRRYVAPPRLRGGRPGQRSFAPHRKRALATIPLLSRIARPDISSPREQGVRLVFGRGCNVFAEERRGTTGQEQDLPTFRQRAFHE